MAQKRATTIIIILIVAAVSIAIATSGALSAISSNTPLPSSGQITTVQTSVNLGLYQNSACTQNATAVDWGALHPGENTTKTVWVKNIGTTNVTLSISATNWAPSNAYLSMQLSWDSGGKILVPSEVIQAALTLSVSPTIDQNITSFSFDIQIIGTA
jgi:hypothetical protein